MTVSTLPSAIKIFFITLNSIYTYKKLLNLSSSKKIYAFTFILSALATPVICHIQTAFPPYTIFAISLFLVPFCSIAFKTKLLQTLCVTILSIGSNYALFTLTSLIAFPIGFVLSPLKLSHTMTSILLLLLTGIAQNILLFLLFRTKRFCNGIPGLKMFIGRTDIFIGGLLILLYSIFFISDRIDPFLDLLLVFFILALGIIIWLWWKKSIHTDYIFQSHTRRIDMLEDTLREKEAELDRLSKIIHKDNKLLAALEHSTRELLSAAPSDTAERLLQELNRFSKERRDTLSAYEAKQLPFPETSLFSIDTMLRYLQQRAQKYAIDFQVHFDENISSITDVITEQDLCTLIADLGENAIIATKSAEIKNILLSIEKKDLKKYTLNFFDSGEPFPEEVLAHLGKKRYTTHAATGGSGIGLMTTSELAQKYQAEFHISSTELSPPYTKCISLTFPHSLREL